MSWQIILAAIGMPVLRSVGGWATKALEDGKVSKFELTKLGQTVLRTGILSTLIYFGADGFGFDVSVVASATSSIILDMIMDSLKKNDSK